MSAQGRFIFRVKSLGIFLTFPHHFVDHELFMTYVQDTNVTIASYAIENHKDGTPHTHIVFVTQQPTLWEAQAFQGVFGTHPHMRRLTTLPDAYRTIAYCCKTTVADLHVLHPLKPAFVYSQILSELFKYMKRAKNAQVQAQFQRQYHAMRQHWLGINPLGTDPYRSSQVESENASQYFE